MNQSVNSTNASPKARDHVRRVLAGLAVSCAWSVSGLAGLALIAWVIGRILTDRFGWSQWLWWIPTPVILVLIVAGMLAASRPALKPGRRRRRVVRWLALFVLVGSYFSLIEHRLLHSQPPVVSSGALRFTHWNAGTTARDDLKPSVTALLAVHGDITIITDPGGMLGDERLGPLTSNGIVSAIGRFGIITKLPILTMRILVATNGRWVALVEVDAAETIGRPISILLVDLPSKISQPRMAVAREVLAMLDAQENLPRPDVVAGDFNITRGSASLGILFPGLREAYDEAGHGYGGSFHREFPLYHIDHILLGDGLKALRYDLIDTGIGRHRAQRAWITASPNSVTDLNRTEPGPASTTHSANEDG